PEPFKARWKSWSWGTTAVRLGVIKGIGFRIGGSPSSASARKEYFDRFVSPKPMAPSVWHSTKRQASPEDCFESGRLVMSKNADAELLEQLKVAYERELVDIEASASYSSQTNTGCFSLEIVLLTKAVDRSTALNPRSGRSSFDMVPLVERCI
ncbi:unnamed protein product, partial [Ectocarpus sp. 8 AP-2014]